MTNDAISLSARKATKTTSLRPLGDQPITSNVIAINQPYVDEALVAMLDEMLARARRGDLKGVMVFAHNRNESGAVMNFAGSFTNRLQLAQYTLVKGLGHIADVIAAQNETAGHTSSAPIQQ